MGTKLNEFREPRTGSRLNGTFGTTNIIGIEDVNGDGRRDLVVADAHCSGGRGSNSVYADATPVPCGTPMGFGDRSGATCPCGNTGQAGSGCKNSTGLGATLQGFGSTSVALDTLYLQGQHLPRYKPTLLLCSSSTQNGGSGIPVTDGLLVCGPPRFAPRERRSRGFESGTRLVGPPS
ncbi:MAG: hypothetical protein ABI054_14185 [Planctomycetota bacterium]